MTTSASPRQLGPFTLDSWEARTATPLLGAAFAFLAVLTIPVIDTHLDSTSKALIAVLNVGIGHIWPTLPLPVLEVPRRLIQKVSVRP